MSLRTSLSDLVETGDREAALKLFCEIVEHAANAPGTTRALRLIAWMNARSEEPGGFLWLAGVLNYTPERLSTMIHETMSAPTRRRQAISRRVARG